MLWWLMGAVASATPAVEQRGEEIHGVVEVAASAT